MNNDDFIELAILLIQKLKLLEARKIALCEMCKKIVNWEGKILGGHMKIVWEFDGVSEK